MEIDPGSVREMPAMERVHVTTEDDGSHYKGEVDTDGDKTGEGTYVWADGSMLVDSIFVCTCIRLHLPQTTEGEGVTHESSQRGTRGFLGGLIISCFRYL